MAGLANARASRALIRRAFQHNTCTLRIQSDLRQQRCFGAFTFPAWAHKVIALDGGSLLTTAVIRAAK